MTCRPCADYRDVVLRCNICWRKTFARIGTFIARSRLRLRHIIIIAANCMIKAPLTFAAIIADVTEASAVQWYEYCRDISIIKMINLHNWSTQTIMKPYGRGWEGFCDLIMAPETNYYGAIWMSSSTLCITILEPLNLFLTLTSFWTI